jgi:enterochelin esterase-like enzyme
MQYFLILLSCLQNSDLQQYFCLLISFAGAQNNIAKSAPPGFDSLRETIPQVRSIPSPTTQKTVGNKRRAIIYTPPSFSKKNTYPVLYLLHGIG